MAKKAAKKSAKKTVKTTKASSNGKFSFVDDLLDEIQEVIQVDKKGQAKIKKTDLKGALEATFERAGKAAAAGQRVRFPAIGALARGEIKARKAGKATNPFTGEEMQVSARPASKKPRWSFPKSLKETFANKRNW
ncbi:MAG: HU family DNA-binding protein [Leptospiraceae bacterium]|nr:HU family DNA-binding protein [Leptospiraceae bacterium]MCB1304590.1 HU family DNA-binding protein [Leptospiraceae bacterium]